MQVGTATFETEEGGATVVTRCLDCGAETGRSPSDAAGLMVVGVAPEDGGDDEWDTPTAI